MGIEKLERYEPDSFRNIKTGEEIEGYCIPDEDGDYVLFAVARAREDALLKELKNARANCGMPSTRESASRVICEIYSTR